MKVVVIGSEGFIGKNLCKHLYNKDLKVIGVDIIDKTLEIYEDYIKADIRVDIDKLVKIFEEHRPEITICLSHDKDTIRGNISIVENILNICSKYGTYLIYFSSAAVYGYIAPNAKPGLENPITLYGIQKLITENTIKLLSKILSYDRWIIVRPWDVLGERCRNNAICMLIDRLLKNKKIDLYFEGLQITDWIHVNDLCRIISNLCIDMYESKIDIPNILNIASGDPKTFREIFNIVKNILDSDEYVINYISFEESFKRGARYLMTYPDRETLRYVEKIGITYNINQAIREILAR